MIDVLVGRSCDIGANNNEQSNEAKPKCRATKAVQPPNRAPPMEYDVLNKSLYKTQTEWTTETRIGIGADSQRYPRTNEGRSALQGTTQIQARNNGGGLNLHVMGAGNYSGW
jgi:hypothetical protein